MNNNDIPNQNPGSQITPRQEDILLKYQKIQQEADQINAILIELGQSSFDQLVKKYNLGQLIILILEPKPINNYNVVDQFVINRQLLVTHFIKPEAMPNISEKTKDNLLSLLATLKTEENPANITTWLTQIDPNLILPENFKVAVYQPRAYELWQASENIKKIIVEATYNDYLGDILKLMFLPDDQYHDLREKVRNLAKEITDSYTHPKSEQPAPQAIIDKILEIFANFGRTPVFIQEMKENNIFGNMVELFSKIEFAVSIADVIKAKNLPKPLSHETVINETKAFVMQDIILR